MSRRKVVREGWGKTTYGEEKNSKELFKQKIRVS